MEQNNGEGELNTSQIEKLVQLQDLTGIEDTEVCKALLESNDWDLESTAREQLGIPGEDNPQDIPPQPQQHQHRDQQPVNPAPQPAPGLVNPGAVWQRPHSLTAWALYLVTLPMRLVYTSIKGVWDFVTSLLGFPPRRASAITDPLGDVNSFYNEFEAQFGTVHPPFFRGTYSQVLEEAKRELKFLIVYLHSEAHQDTENFCRGTLCDNLFVEYVSQNMLFWGCSVRRQEGHRVSQALRENAYPFLAVIVLRQNRMVVVARIEGNISAPALVERLMTTVTDYEAFIVAARAERDERNFNRNIRSEQDQAFLETLRQDQEREEKKKNEEDVKKKEDEERKKVEEEEKRKEKEEQDEKEKIARLKIDLVDEIPEQPDSSHEDAIRVMIKLPDGQRLERRFLKTHSLKYIYYFVFCHPESPDEFSIMSNYPKKTLACKPVPGEADPPTLQESGFGRSEVLFVNDLNA